ncbi:MAG: tetratricopeptide repeat protein [Clostridiales bacterium]|nr:tetratricopeptide repeat protein [Clostridiales bacterium]
MSSVVEILTCPGCGNPLSIGQEVCDWCHRPVVISTFNSVYSGIHSNCADKYASAYGNALRRDPDNPALNKAIAFCYLKLKLYSKALAAFEKAIEDDFNDSELYFYAAVCLLNGEKAFCSHKPTIDKVLQYLNAAISIEPKGIYYYYMAYIKYDYFARHNFRTSPNYMEALRMAMNAGLSRYDVEQLYKILGVDKPACL